MIFKRLMIVAIVLLNVYVYMLYQNKHTTQVAPKSYSSYVPNLRLHAINKGLMPPPFRRVLALEEAEDASLEHLALVDKVVVIPKFS